MKKNKKGKKKLKKVRKGTRIKFPVNLLNPVAKFLHNRLRLLERRKKDVEEEDPFSDPARVLDNASPDTDADEQFGHARTSAVKRELDRKIIQTKKALARIKIGKYGICEDCGKMIDTDRLMVYPEATLCANCQKKRES